MKVQMQMSKEVATIMDDVKKFNDKYPYMQQLKGYFVSGENLNELEFYLRQLLPNIVITHSLTDTEEDKINQEVTLRNIYSNNMLPYYIDINVKQKMRSLTLD